MKQAVWTALSALLPLLITTLPAGPAAQGETDERRVVRRFDFEDAARAPVTFPFEFVNAADRYGLGRFGHMTLDRSHAWSGEWSFRFDPDGISLIASVPTGIIPVIPHADYRVSVRTRSEQLVRGGVRLSATLHDARGNALPAATFRSPIIRPGKEWTELSVSIPGNAPEAATLTVDLEVLQPDLLPRRTEDLGRALPADIGARVWFDALIVEFEARVDLAPLRSFPVYTSRETPTFRVIVRDFAGDDLQAHATLRDLRNEVVFAADLPAPRGGRPFDLRLEDLLPGWYHLTLNVRGERGTIATRTGTFAVLAPRLRAGGGHRTAPRFTIVHPWRADESLNGLSERIARINPDESLIEIWHESMTNVDDAERLAAIRTELERLTALDIESGFVLGGLPSNLALQAGLDPHDVFALLAAPGEAGRHAINLLLHDPALRVRRWQIGLDPPDSLARTEAGSRELTELLRRMHPDPDVRGIRHPFLASREQADHRTTARSTRLLPSTIAPEHTEAHLTDEDSESLAPGISIIIAPPDAQRFSPYDRAIDHALRTIAAWSVQPTELLSESPWKFDTEQQTFRVDPLFPIWHRLSDALGSRRYAGRLPAPDHVHILLAEGAGPDDHAMILYADQHVGSPQLAPVALPGSARARHMIDLEGRSVAPSSTESSALSVVPGAMPIIIEGVDLQPGRFIQSLAFDPPELPWTQRISEHELLLRNPWPHPISGVITLESAGGVTFEPSRLRFSVPSGEVARLPIEVRTERGTPSGLHEINASVRIEGSRPETFSTNLPLTIGWPAVELVSTWRAVASDDHDQLDLLVRLRITNRAERSLLLQAVLLAPGFPRDQRIIGRLEPGATAVRHFRLSRGMQRLGGASILSVIEEMDGPGRLNQPIAIPPITENRRASVAADR